MFARACSCATSKTDAHMSLFLEESALDPFSRSGSSPRSAGLARASQMRSAAFGVDSDNTAHATIGLVATEPTTTPEARHSSERRCTAHKRGFRSLRTTTPAKPAHKVGKDDLRAPFSCSLGFVSATVAPRPGPIARLRSEARSGRGECHRRRIETSTTSRLQAATLIFVLVADRFSLANGRLFAFSASGRPDIQ